MVLGKKRLNNPSLVPTLPPSLIIYLASENLSPKISIAITTPF